jgi:hypothetical protein
MAIRNADVHAEKADECVHGHQPVPVSLDLHAPHDRKPTRWRCRWCGKRVDPTTLKAA